MAYAYTDDPGEDECIGYYCLGCEHIQNSDGQCDRCTGWSMDPIYE